MIGQALRPLRNRVYMLISRAVIEMAKDEKGMQYLKLSAMAKEDRDDVERFQNYGFTSVPKEGAEAIVLCPQGNREHMVAIVVDDRRYRLKGMAEGEVAMFTDEGDVIHIKRGGHIEIKAADKVDIIGANEVSVDSASIKLGKTAAEAVIKGTTFQGLFNAHVHLSGPPGNNTSTPIVPLTGTELSTVSKTE